MSLIGRRAESDIKQGSDAGIGDEKKDEDVEFGLPAGVWWNDEVLVPLEFLLWLLILFLFFGWLWLLRFVAMFVVFLVLPLPTVQDDERFGVFLHLF